MAAEKSSFSGKVLKIVLVLFTLGVIGVGLFYFLILRPAGGAINKAGEKISQGIGVLFNTQPRITIDNTVVIEESISTLELAVLTQPIFQSYRYSDTQHFSTKILHLEGVYTAKAGFNLKKGPVALDFTSKRVEGESVPHLKITLPEPEILSFETDDYKVLKDEDGWWNIVTEADRENAVREMKASAKQQALDEGILEKTKTSIESQLRTIVMQSGFDIVIEEIRYQSLEKPVIEEVPRP